MSFCLLSFSLFVFLSLTQIKTNIYSGATVQYSFLSFFFNACFFRVLFFFRSRFSFFVFGGAVFTLIFRFRFRFCPGQSIHGGGGCFPAEHDAPLRLRQLGGHPHGDPQGDDDVLARSHKTG